MNLDSLAEELDRLYEFEIREYIARCDELKRSGLKIYRNEAGKHKVALAGQRPRKEEVQYVTDKKKDKFFVRAKNYIVNGFKNIKNMFKAAKFIYKNSKKN